MRTAVGHPATHHLDNAHDADEHADVAIDHAHVDASAPHHQHADTTHDDSHAVDDCHLRTPDHADDGHDRYTTDCIAAADGIPVMTENDEQSPGLPKWIGVVGLFIAPTTVITSLCYYYGYVATRTFFSSFGIDADAIGFTSTDYVMKSVSTLYVPLVGGLLTWVAMLWIGEYVRRLVRSGRRPRLVRGLAWAAVAIGSVGVVRAVIGLTQPTWALIHIDAVTPAALGIGSALLMVGCWMLAATKAGDAARPYAAAQRASLVVAAAAIVAALFWITHIFASFRGVDQAANVTADLWSRENSVVVDVDAAQNMPLLLKDQIKVSWAPPSDPSAKPTFLRYECFRVLAVHNNRWALVPARWNTDAGFAVVVDADPAHVISMRRIKDIADTDAAKHRDRNWECPEVGLENQRK